MDIKNYIGETTEYDKNILFLHVNAGNDTPYYYIGDGVLETFVRVGNESIVADSTEHKRLVLRGHNSTFDARSSEESFGDYSFSKLRSRYYAWNGASFNDKFFQSFGLVDKDGMLTNAGLLMADENSIRQSRVFCTRWNGRTKAGGIIDALDSAEITGSLVSLLEDTMSFIRRNVRTIWYKEPMQRIEIPEYIERSVMEVITNALAHRDYLIQGSEVHVDMFDDRMEIYSPGAMPEGRLIQNMDLDNIPSIRRNPVIADIFTQLGYMERKGSGMGKIIYPLRALPYFTERMLPVFFSDRAQFTVTFPNIVKIWLEEHPDIETKFDVTQDVTQEKNLDQWIEYQIAANPKITTDELAELSGKTSRTIKRHLVKLPHIRFIGSGYSGHWEIDKK